MSKSNETKKMIVDVPIEVHKLVKEYQKLLKNKMYLEQGLEPVEKNRYKVEGRITPLPKVLSLLLSLVAKDIETEIMVLRRANQNLLDNIKND